VTGLAHRGFLAGRVAVGAFQGQENLFQRVSDCSPQPSDDLVGVGGAVQAEAAQRSAAEKRLLRAGHTGCERCARPSGLEVLPLHRYALACP